MNNLISCTDDKVGEYSYSKKNKSGCYTQILLSDYYKIPLQKPDSNKIVGCHHTIKILKVLSLDSRDKKDYEKKQCNKIVISGVFCLGIEYLAQNSPSVHFIESETLFNVSLDIDHKNYNCYLPEELYTNVNRIKYCLEYLSISSILPRTLKKTIVLMIWLEINEFKENFHGHYNI